MNILIALGLLIAAIGEATAKMADTDAAPTSHYYKRKPLSQAEQLLYSRLVTAVPAYRVLAKVSLYQLVGLKKAQGRQTAFNKIIRKCADFVVCTPSFEIVAVIELDDASHDTKRRRTSDKERDHALIAAGHRVIRWHVAAMPSTEEITALFNALTADSELIPLTAAA